MKKRKKKLINPKKIQNENENENYEIFVMTVFKIKTIKHQKGLNQIFVFKQSRYKLLKWGLPLSSTLSDEYT